MFKYVGHEIVDSMESKRFQAHGLKWRTETGDPVIQSIGPPPTVSHFGTLQTGYANWPIYIWHVSWDGNTIEAGVFIRAQIYFSWPKNNYTIWAQNVQPSVQEGMDPNSSFPHTWHYYGFYRCEFFFYSALLILLLNNTI